MDAETVSQQVHWFWTESIWLPEGFTWKDYVSTSTLTKADIKELYYIPIFVVVLTGIRFLFEFYIAKPICLSLGIKDNACERNEICERIYNTVTRYPKSNECETIAKETKMTNGEISSWFRKRRASARGSKMRKSTETCWRAFVYLSLFIYGSIVLWRTKWFLDSSKWITNFVSHEFTREIKWYYFMEISFYFSLLFSQFFDTKRKDFVQQFIHHVATLSLLLGSYILSYYRLGVLVMYIHDTSDFWLEAAKLTNYAKKQRCCDTLFAVFAVLFFLTRLVYYPCWIAYSYFKYNVHKNGIVMQTMVCLSFVLLFLNFYWGYLVLKLAYKVIITGKAAKDSRSDTEDSEGGAD